MENRFKKIIGLFGFTVISVTLLAGNLSPAFFTATDPVYAATSPNLGTAATYSILAGSAVTNTGATTISGDVGISPGTVTPNFTGFGTVTLGGVIHDADGAALTAQADKNTAYNALASQGCDIDYGAVTKDLAGETLVPGVYCAGSFHLTGTLTLNGAASDVWIFKSASDLILTGGTAVKILFTGGGQPCNVWWRVVSTATFDANSTFVGNILADTSITLAAGASLNGRALARTAEVTLSSNSITAPTCVTAPTGTPSPTPETPTGTPTLSPSPEASPSPEISPSPSPTATPTDTPTTPIPSLSPIPTGIGGPNSTPSPTPSVSPSPTATPAPSEAPTPSPTTVTTASTATTTTTTSGGTGGSVQGTQTTQEVKGAQTFASTGKFGVIFDLLLMLGAVLTSLSIAAYGTEKILPKKYKYETLFG